MGGFVSRSDEWLVGESKTLERAEIAMNETILHRGVLLAPKLTGALQADGRVEKEPDGHHSVVFGDESVPYARRRHFENKKNPQTLGYLQKAGDSVAKENVKKYVDMSR